MKFRTIDDLVDKVATWNPSKAASEERFTYIDLGSVDQQEKRIVNAAKVSPHEAPSRARQIVKTGDVLVSTVRPNLNAVALVSADMDGATASTGFCVLRPKREVDSSYLFHWVRSPLFISEMTRRATGQSYPAVSDRIVKNSLIPTPSMQVQKQIADVLNGVEILRAKRRRAITLLDDLAQSIFLDMFGDVVENDRHWSSGQVSDLVARFESGKSFAASSEDESRVRYRILKVSAVTSGQFLSGESKPVPSQYEPPASHIVRNGDLIFSRANTESLIGAVALAASLPSNLILPDKLWRFVWHDANLATPFYVRQLFRQAKFRREVSRRSSGTSGSMKNISQPKVLSIKCGVPPLALRRGYDERMKIIENLKAKQNSHLDELNALFESIQYSAFQGELWADSSAV